MRYLKSFPLFETLQPVPSHEAISTLPEWEKMSWCSPEWTTPPDLYEKGIRFFTAYVNPISAGRGFRIRTYDGIFMSDSGIKIFNLKFDTMEDWNDSVRIMNAAIIEDTLYNLSLNSKNKEYLLPYRQIVEILKGSKISSGSILFRLIKDRIFHLTADPKAIRPISEGEIKLIHLLFNQTAFDGFSEEMNKDIQKDLRKYNEVYTKTLIDSGILTLSELTKTYMDADSWGLMG